MIEADKERIRLLLVEIQMLRSMLEEFRGTPSHLVESAHCTRTNPAWGDLQSRVDFVLAVPAGELCAAKVSTS